MKKKINYLLIAGILIIATVLILNLYVNGYRFTEMQAIKVSPMISDDIKAFGQVKRDWATVYLLDTAGGLKTALVVKRGLLWHCDSVTYFFDDVIKNDKVKTVGWTSVSEKNNKQITVFAVQTTDPNVKFIEAGPKSGRERKPVKLNETTIFTWDKRSDLNDINPIALDKSNLQLHRYGFPENKNITNTKDLRWYPVNNQ